MHMAKILFNITNGTGNPTKASLGFMLARTAVEEGHEVIVFLNADAVSLMRTPVLDNLVGLGTGKLKEHFNVLKENNVLVLDFDRYGVLLTKDLIDKEEINGEELAIILNHLFKNVNITEMSDKHREILGDKIKYGESGE